MLQNIEASDPSVRNDDATPLAQGQDLRSVYIYMYTNKSVRVDAYAYVYVYVYVYVYWYAYVYMYVYVYTAMTTYGNDDATPLAQGQDLRSVYMYMYMYIQKCAYIDRKKRGFPIYYVITSRTVSKRTPLEEFVPNSSRGVLLLTVLDEGK